MKPGIQTHQWGFYRIGDSTLIATCIAQTYYEAETYFEDIGLDLDLLHAIRVINKLTS